MNANGHRPAPPPRRFRGLPQVAIKGRWVPVAISRRTRLLGLALLERSVAGDGLLIPRCRRVHTFGMRFALDLVFLDAQLQPLATAGPVGARRFVGCPEAAAVLELPSGGGLRGR